MDGNNIAKNSRKATGKPFVKGDPRCWRKGRPRSFDALRELAIAIAHEKTGEVEDGHAVSQTEKILRQWATSRNPILQRAFLEIAFGKVPDNINLGGKAEVVLRVIRDMQSGSRIPDTSTRAAQKTSGNKE